jgi:hypothetical protein
MAIDFEAVMASEVFQSKCSKANLEKYRKEWTDNGEEFDFDWDQLENASQVFCQEVGGDNEEDDEGERYTGGISDGSGANFIWEWNGLYFYDSTDFEAEGPFDSLEEALSNSEFSFSSGSQISCDCETDEEQKAMAERLIGKEDDGTDIWINGVKFIVEAGAVVKVEPKRKPEA